MSVASLAAASKSSPRRDGAGCRSTADVASMPVSADSCGEAPVVRRILELPAWQRASTSCRMNLLQKHMLHLHILKTYTNFRVVIYSFELSVRRSACTSYHMFPQQRNVMHAAHLTIRVVALKGLRG